MNDGHVQVVVTHLPSSNEQAEILPVLSRILAQWIVRRRKPPPRSLLQSITITLPQNPDPLQLDWSRMDASNNDEEEIAKKSSFAFDVLRWRNDSPPEWLVTAHSAIVGSIRKGIKSNFKKSVQETIATSASVWRKAFQVFPPGMWIFIQGQE